MINSFDEIYIEKNGIIVKVENSFLNKEKLMDLIYRIVSEVNRQVNTTSPIVDARLSDGSRVNVVLDPISIKGPSVTIRKFKKKCYSLEELKLKNAFNEKILKFLIHIIKHNFNIFISGGTSSGKTTLLNALSNHINHNERIITIEDSAELKFWEHDNVISLETRNSNFSKNSEITIADLIKASLRMRPDRIIVGEVRSFEAIDMIQAMNTGHDGSLSTGHGNSNIDMLYRLETMILSNAKYPIEAVRNQITSGIDILINIKRYKDSVRRISAIDLIESSSVNGYKLRNLFSTIYDVQNCEYKIIESGEAYEEILKKFYR
ncbi:hypothetical protein HLPR_19510 [Helicovermis profundi]|uniref:Bacterial type II secretion system protein E domain-containing protein n=2 Tax=Helicovermis profundi TaxID=3065157 RepID=A0AAU9ET46_9FIRM|nr:hypothetical protein HLPR_19510 [Clostridia bacterium S502]